MLSLVFLAIAAFVATNMDNLCVLLAFLAEARDGRRGVVIGEYAGSIVLIVVSIVLAGLLTRLPGGYVGLLGVLPIGVGLSKAWQRFRPVARVDDGTPDGAAPQASSWWTVACVGIANGSDNLAVYVPLYAGHSRAAGALISLVFIAMVGIWCAGAAWLVEHPLLGAPIRRYGTALLPVILIGIGISVIAQSDALRIVFGIG